MPKLDLPNAVRIKTESGEVTRLKGSAFNWSSPHYSGADHATLTGDFKRGHYVADDSKVDTLDQSFDYSGGLGTMTDSDGVLKWQPHNLLAYSEDLTQSDWTASKLNSGIAPVVTSNYATAPDGTETADRIVFDSGGTTSSDWSFIRQLNSGLTATDHTFVVFVKSTDGTDQNLEFHINGSPTGSITATSEWQAVSYEYTHTNYFGLMVNGDGSQQTADILVWGAHLYRSDLGGMVSVPVAERGLTTSSTYLPNTTASPRYLPRVGHHKYDSNTAKWNAHNLLTYSEDFTQWTALSLGAGVTPVVTGNYATAPDGTETASLVALDRGGSGIGDISQVESASLSVAASTNYTGEVWVKAATGADVGKEVGLRHVGNSTYEIITLTDDWVKIDREETVQFTSHIFSLTTRGTITSDQTVSFLVWGAHLYRSDLNGVVANSGNDLSGLYVPTTATATEPTLNTEVSYKNKGLRLESEARTNLYLRSLGDDLTGLTTSGVTVGASGWGNGLDSVFEYASGVSAWAYTSTTTTAQDYTISCIAECGDGLEPSFGSASASAATNDFVFVIDGIVINPTTYEKVDLGDGLWFVWGTFTSVGDTNNNGIIKYNTNVADTLKVSGIQIEPGDTPSSLIPTYGATATRPAETFETPAGTAPWSGISNTTVRREADYVSGYLPTDTKGAWLSDTDDTDAGTELVTNGTFDTDTTGWSAATATITTVSGEIELTSTGGNRPKATQVITTEIGKVYRISALARQGTTASALEIEIAGISSASSGSMSSTTQAEIYSTFTATSTSHTLQIKIDDNPVAVGETAYFDNVSVKLVEPDRSTNDNGLAINGTITKTAVATGAELVAYSGFSASNYLEQPYNSDLDFGTGDFCVMGWAGCTSYTNSVIAARTQVGSNNNGWELQGGTSEILVLNMWDGSGTLTQAVSTENIPEDGSFFHYAAVRNSDGSVDFYINGEFSNNDPGTVRDLSNGSCVLTVGASLRSGSPGSVWAAGSLALLRIAGSAPTAAEILEIYNREKVLFEDNAAITDMQVPEVSIAMKGEMNYVDSATNDSILRWYKSSQDYFIWERSTTGARTGKINFFQVESNITDVISSADDTYSPGLNVPFNIASYHEVNKINGAVDGTALTADTTPASLPDLSAIDIQWGYDFMGTIEYINVWDTSEEDTGIVYITE